MGMILQPRPLVPFVSEQDAPAYTYLQQLLTIQAASMQVMYKLDEVSTQLPVDGSGHARNITNNTGPIQENCRVFLDGTVAAGFRPEGAEFLLTTNAALMTALATQAEITFACWIRINNTGSANSAWNDANQYTIWQTLNHTGVNAITICKGPTANTIRVKYSDGTTTITVDNNVGTPGDTWHSLVVTVSKSNSRIRVYFDGVSQGNTGDPTTVSISSGPSGVYLAKLSGSSWLGWIKYATIWNVELQQADVTTYNSMIAGSAITPNKLVVFDGDSLSTDFGLSVGQGWCRQTMAALGTAGWDYYYFGDPSSQTTQLLRYISLDVTPLYSAARAKNIYWLWNGTNDIKAGVSPTTVYNNLKSLCNTAQAAGFKVGISNIIPRTDVTGTNETNRQTLNTSLANDHSFADAFADLNAQPNLQTPSNTTYFQAGGVHLTQAGYAVVEGVVEPLIAAF